ncbi:MAG: YwaF family protein [Lachnospiraceae bacterium]|nr:YwaF family protein [Lachnospiraceae bacterium]
MFEFYFTYWSDLPADSGYDTFGIVHLTWLAGIAIAIVLCTVLFLKCSSPSQDQFQKCSPLSPDQFPKQISSAQDRFLKTLAGIMLAMEAYREIVLIVTGHMEFENLPLHLCGLAIFAEALFAFFPNSFLGEFTCVACLPGAASALIFPDWLRYPTVNYMNLHGFIMHGILVMFPILVLVSGKYVPHIRRIYMPVLFFAVAAPILHRLNAWQGSNFMFLNRPSLGSPFEAVYEAYGYGVYLAVFGVTVFAVILAMYGGIGLIRFILKRTSD